MAWYSGVVEVGVAGGGVARLGGGERRSCPPITVSQQFKLVALSFVFFASGERLPAMVEGMMLEWMMVQHGRR